MEIKTLINELKELDETQKIDRINKIRLELHKISPFKNEPVDCVLWVKNEEVKANDYNPNVVAPPEMELLGVSIEQDGYTQPIVTFKEKNNGIEVIDGFHRCGKEFESIKKRVKEYLPIVIVNQNRTDKGDRIASTIRHNRARGKHTIDGMAEIVIDLKKRNWSDKKNKRNANEFNILNKIGLGINTFDKLTKETKLSKATVNKHLKRLINEGKVKKELDTEGHIRYRSTIDKKYLTDLAIKSSRAVFENTKREFENMGKMIEDITSLLPEGEKGSLSSILKSGYKKMGKTFKELEEELIDKEVKK